MRLISYLSTCAGSLEPSLVEKYDELQNLIVCVLAPMIKKIASSSEISAYFLNSPSGIRACAR